MKKNLRDGATGCEMNSTDSEYSILDICLYVDWTKFPAQYSIIGLFKVTAL